MLPVKTARDPDPTGSPMHMDFQSRRVAARTGERDSSSFERKSSVPAPLKSFVIIERQDVRPRDNISHRDTLETTRVASVIGLASRRASVANC